MSHEITYYELTPELLDKMIREAARPEEYLNPTTASKRFDCSPDFLATLVKEKTITKYEVPGHSKSTRYKLSELEKAFKPNKT